MNVQSSRIFDVPCTITVRHDWESLEAHVELDGDITPHPGDKIRVHGASVQVPFGESITIRRNATVKRAGFIENIWVRIMSRFEITELYEVSFSTGRL